MKLTIAVIGLILLVPDPQNGRLHLLMPSAEGVAERHLTWIGDTNPVSSPIRMDGWALDLSDIAPRGRWSANPPHVLALTPEVHGVPRSWLTGTTVPLRLQSRITLPLPDSMVAGSTVRWKHVIGNGTTIPVRLTNEVRLVYDSVAIGTTLRTRSQLRAGATGPGSIQLPIDAAGHLEIRQVPVGRPGPVPPGDFADHFWAYHRLFGRTGWFPALEAVEEGDSTAHAYFLARMGTSPWNCMLAWAPVDETS